MTSETPSPAAPVGPPEWAVNMLSAFCPYRDPIAIKEWMTYAVHMWHLHAPVPSRSTPPIEGLVEGLVDILARQERILAAPACYSHDNLELASDTVRNLTDAITQLTQLQGEVERLQPDHNSGLDANTAAHVIDVAHARIAELEAEVAKWKEAFPHMEPSFVQQTIRLCADERDQLRSALALAGEGQKKTEPSPDAKLREAAIRHAAEALLVASAVFAIWGDKFAPLSVEDFRKHEKAFLEAALTRPVAPSATERKV